MRAYLAANLKDHNRKTVYKLVFTEGEISKAEISRKTGISPPTVTKIVNFFLDRGLLVEIGEGDTALGRKPQILRFNQDAAFSIGIGFEGDYLSLGIVDLLGGIKYLKKFRVRSEFDNIIMKQLIPNIETVVKEAGISKEKLLGIGLGIPGVVDTNNHMLEFAPLIGVCEKINYKTLIDDFSKRIGLPVYVENDANAAAKGEYVTRKLGHNQDLIYISLGTGLGSGIILNGRLRRGRHSFAGEIGYMVFDKDFHTSKSSAGWMESRINLKALSEKSNIFEHIDTDNLQKFISDDGNYDQLVDYVASDLGLCIANISTVMDIELVVLGGICTEIFGEKLLLDVREYLSRLCIFNMKCEFSLSPEPTVVGAASIATEHGLQKLLED